MNALSLSLKHRVLVLVAVPADSCWSAACAFQQLNIEAYPDPTAPMVDVVTQSAGLSAEEIERYITIPIETQIAGMPNLNAIRTISLYGLSDVKLQFTFDYTYEQALQQVLNRLSQLPPLPNNAQPKISPTSPIGEIYPLQVDGAARLQRARSEDAAGLGAAAPLPRHSRRDRRHRLGRQDQNLRAPGRLQQADRLRADAAAAADGAQQRNINVGGNTVNIGAQVGGRARRRPDSLPRRHQQHDARPRAAAIPVLVKDVATVTVGNQPRLGIAGMDSDDDIVQGIVLMRRGEQSTPTIVRV